MSMNERTACDDILDDILSELTAKPNVDQMPDDSRPQPARTDDEVTLRLSQATYDDLEHILSWYLAFFKPSSSHTIACTAPRVLDALRHAAMERQGSAKADRHGGEQHDGT